MSNIFSWLLHHSRPRCTPPLTLPRTSTTQQRQQCMRWLHSTTKRAQAQGLCVASVASDYHYEPQLQLDRRKAPTAGRLCARCGTKQPKSRVIQPQSSVGRMGAASALELAKMPKTTTTDTPTTGQPREASAQTQTQVPTRTTFYRRPLPSHLTSFTSSQGKKLFTEALADGHAELYFPLVGNFTSQTHPAYCGLGSLAMVLNALEIDPGENKIWKGPWRWWYEENLECCAPEEVIKQRGITYREFACLARCNGLKVTAKRGGTVSLEEFIQDIRLATSSNDTHLVVSFSRKTLGQTGDGHFSPLGAYHQSENKVLVLDVARFKYPSYFVPVELLYEALKPIDRETGLPRGYFLLTRASRPDISLCKLIPSHVSHPALFQVFCSDIPRSFAVNAPNSLLEVAERILTSLPRGQERLLQLQPAGIDRVGDQESVEREHQALLDELISEVKTTPIYSLLAQLHTDITDPIGGVELSTILLLSMPREALVTLPLPLRTQYESLREVKSSPALKEEVAKIHEQLESLMNSFCRCRLKNTGGVRECWDTERFRNSNV